MFNSSGSHRQISARTGRGGEWSSIVMLHTGFILPPFLIGEKNPCQQLLPVFLTLLEITIEGKKWILLNICSCV
jgi:hypothetical protein